MLNGLLPCGFVYFFAITAASTASSLWGAVVMMVFGLSTTPALFGLGLDYFGSYAAAEWLCVVILLALLAMAIAVPHAER